jgi:glutathione S-transferase
MKTKLYSGPLSMFGAKAEIALREKGVDFELEMVAFSQAQGYQPRHPEVLRVNPKRQVPVLIDGDVEIFDSTQIFEYAEHRWPEPALWPASPAERAAARQLEHASDEVFFPHVIKLMGLRATPDPVDSPEWVHARTAIETYYTRMETLLAQRDWLARTFTYADIAFYLAQFFAARHTVPMNAAHPHLLAWRRRVAARPAVRPVIDRMVGYLRSIDYPVPDYGVPDHGAPDTGKAITAPEKAAS